MKNLSKMIGIYTDGSCLKNPNGPGGWAFCIIKDTWDYSRSGGNSSTTNNRMELQAVIEALKEFDGKDCRIYSDSQLTIKCASNEWERNANLDMWKEFDVISERFNMIEWEWVKAHNGNTYNELVDEMCRYEANKIQKKAALATKIPDAVPLEEIISEELFINADTCDKIVSKQHVVKTKSGSNCSKEGGKYEEKVWDVCTRTRFRGNRFNTQDRSTLGGSSTKNDIVFNLASNNGRDEGGIEVKNTLSTEFMQLDVKYKDGEWQGPVRSKHPPGVIERMLKEIKSESVFYGNPPSFPFKTRKDFDDWQTSHLEEKKRNNKGTRKDYMWRCRDLELIKKKLL